MDAGEAYRRLFAIFPKAQIDTDNEGQIIVYTNMRETERDKNNLPLTLESMDEQEN